MVSLLCVLVTLTRFSHAHRGETMFHPMKEDKFIVGFNGWRWLPSRGANERFPFRWLRSFLAYHRLLADTPPAFEKDSSLVWRLSFPRAGESYKREGA